MQDGNFLTTHKKKRKGPNTNGRVMKLKCIKHDEALKDLAGQLKELNATNIISSLTMQDDKFRARHEKKRKDQKLSLENGRRQRTLPGS